LYGDEEMKIRIRGGRVLEMSKAMRPEDADAENLGVVKFGPASAPRLIEIMDAIVGAGGRRDWAPKAFSAFAAERPLYAIGTRGYPWIEIDFPEDYHRAVGEVLPAIDALEEETRPYEPAREIGRGL
jgi:choline kinase